MFYTPVTPTNNLQYCFPCLAKEWHPSKNKIAPTQVTTGSNRKIWWKCDNGHEFLSVIKNRVNGTRCPECRKLEFKFPALAKEYHPTRNSTPLSEIMAGSNRIIWWKCSKGHEFQCGVRARHEKDKLSACPHCRTKVMARGK